MQNKKSYRRNLDKPGQLSKADNCVAFFVGNEAKSVPARKPTNRKDHKWR